MTDMPAPPQRRLWHRIPVIGWILWDLQRDFRGNAPYAAMIALLLLVLGVQQLGLAAIVLAAVLATPVIFTVLIIIAKG